MFGSAKVIMVVQTHLVEIKIDGLASKSGVINIFKELALLSKIELIWIRLIGDIFRK